MDKTVILLRTYSCAGEYNCVRYNLKSTSMKKIIYWAALALGTTALINGLLSTSAYAAAVTSDVQIEVKVPDIVFLTTYDKITFNLEAADLTDATVTSGSVLDKTAGSGTVAPGPTTVTPALTATAGTLKTTKTYSDVVLYKTWGLGAVTGQIEHGITAVTSNTLTSTGTGPVSTITMSSPIISSPLAKDDAPGIDPTAAIDGTFDFTFDFIDVKRSGVHTGGLVTVSAAGI